MNLIGGICGHLNLPSMANYIASYPWAKMEFIRETSIYTSIGRVKAFPSSQAISKTNEDDTEVKLCVKGEPICKSDFDDVGSKFCFFYETVFFFRLGVHLSLDTFEKEVLTIINVAPVQLHPNSWTFLRTFHILYTYFRLIPTSNWCLFVFSNWKTWLKTLGLIEQRKWKGFTISVPIFPWGFQRLLYENLRYYLLIILQFVIWWSQVKPSARKTWRWFRVY